MQNVPVWVVGNKADLCTNVLATMRSHWHDHHHQPTLMFHSSQHQTSSPYDDLMPAFKDLANLVRKQWKCCYLECSAKYNWRIVPIFREIIKSLESSLPTRESQSQNQPPISHRETQFRCTIKVGGMSNSLSDLGNDNRSQLPTENYTVSEGQSNSVCAII